VAGWNGLRRSRSAQGRSHAKQGPFRPELNEQAARLCARTGFDIAGFVYGRWHRSRSRAEQLPGADSDQCNRDECAVPISGGDAYDERGEGSMMIPRHKSLSRRTVLRGAGVALGLPWLEAMTPCAYGQSRAAQAPVRMAVLYMANGVNTSQWTPQGSGKDF